MNYNSRLQDHITDTFNVVPQGHIVGVFLQGSQNYGLDTESSDVDTKCIVTPTLYSLAMNHKPTSSTFVRANDEHIDMKDIRLILKIFRKQNINFIEILFTKYYWINPVFVSHWDKLINQREEIAHIDIHATLKAAKGMAHEKYNHLEHPFPSRIKLIEQFGYDPKQLSHVLRLKDFVHKYLNGDDYENCLNPFDPEFIKSVKSGCIPLSQARSLAAETMDDISCCVDLYCEHNKPEVDKAAISLLEDIQYQIIELSVKRDMGLGF